MAQETKERHHGLHNSCAGLRFNGRDIFFCIFRVIEPLSQKLELMGVTFELSATNSGSPNKLTIAADRLRQVTDPIIIQVKVTVATEERG